MAGAGPEAQAELCGLGTGESSRRSMGACLSGEDPRRDGGGRPDQPWPQPDPAQAGSPIPGAGPSAGPTDGGRRPWPAEHRDAGPCPWSGGQSPGRQPPATPSHVKADCETPQPVTAGRSPLEHPGRHLYRRDHQRLNAVFPSPEPRSRGELVTQLAVASLGAGVITSLAVAQGQNPLTALGITLFSAMAAVAVGQVL